jgi:hypothetical protein
MKLFTIILILIIGCQEPEIKGCMTSGACNYNPDATFYDYSCEYVSDCLGVCGGSAVIDDCNECNGGNVSMDCAGVCGGMTTQQECDGCEYDFDCLGVCDGSAVVDDCNECNGGNVSMDCAGICGGITTQQYCDECEYVFDCLGVCGGSAEIDDCGVCDGDGSTCDAASGCMDNMANNYNSNATIDDDSCTYTEHPENSLWLIPYSDTTWGIGYNASTPIGGFQFDVDGVTISEASGGEAEANGFNMAIGANGVIGFTLTGGYLPLGENILTIITLAGTPTGISDIVISDPSGDQIIFTFYMFLTSLESTGNSQLTIFSSSITTLEVGDQIGIFDVNGLTNYSDCSNQIGELLVGAGVWDDSQLNLVSIGSSDLCAFGGTQLAGFVSGHPVVVKVWRESEQIEYATQLTWGTGTGNFGDTIQSVSEIELSD